MADVLWYYEEAGKPAGPVSEAALAEAIRQGRLTRGQRVWTAGQQGWLAWDAVPALAALAPSPAPPPLTETASAAPGVAGGWGAPAPSAPAQVPPAQGWSPPPPPAASAGATAGTYARAPLWPRFAAALLDGVIGSGPLAVTMAVLAVLTEGFSETGGPAAWLAVVLVAAALWALWYGFTKDGRPGGQSIGKRTMQLMVVHLPTDQPCTVGQSALRAMVQAVLQLVPYVGWLVEPIMVLAAPDGRRLGDKAAGTQVILASDWRQRR